MESSEEDDELTDREKKFDRAIGRAARRHGGSSFLFKETIFNGTVEVRKVVVSLLVIWRCRALDDFLVLEECLKNDYEAIRKYESPIYDHAEKEYDIEFLDLSESIFYEDAEIDDVFRFIRMHNTRFKENSIINERYMGLTKGHVIRRMDEARRLIDDKQPSLQELYRSCDSNDYETKLRLFKDVKTQERKEAEWWRKPGYVTHELLSDYGKSPTRVLLSIVMTIAVFAILFWSTDNGTCVDCLIGSCSSFFTVGINAFDAETELTKMLTIAEGALGLILMSYFVVVLCERRKL